MKINKELFLALIVLVFFLPALLHSRIVLQTEEDPSSGLIIENFINQIKKHNSSIQSYFGGIYAQGYLNRKQFKATGRIWADIKKDYAKVRFEDLIFKSPISIFLMQNEKITLYYPAQKKRIITTVSKFEPAYDAGLPLPSDLLLPMIKGHFFLPDEIEQKSIKKTADGNIVTLESKKYIVNYFLGKDGYPVQAQFQNKMDKEWIQFTYKNYSKIDNSFIPLAIQIQPAKSRNYLNLKITWLKVNKEIGNIWNLN